MSVQVDFSQIVFAISFEKNEFQSELVITLMTVALGDNGIRGVFGLTTNATFQAEMDPIFTRNALFYLGLRKCLLPDFPKNYEISLY